MKLIFIITAFLLLENCSLNSDSEFWTQDQLNISENQKKLSNFSKNISYSTEMSFYDFENYVDDYTKKSKYPDINK